MLTKFTLVSKASKTRVRYAVHLKTAVHYSQKYGIVDQVYYWPISCCTNVLKKCVLMQCATSKPFNES